MPQPAEDHPPDRRPTVESMLVAALAGVGGVAGSFAVAGFTPAFVAGPIAGFLARRLPAAVITFAIVMLGDLGEQLNVIAALGLAVLLFAAAAQVGRTLGATLDQPWVGGGLGAALGGIVAFAGTGAAGPSIAAGLAIGLVLWSATLGGTMYLPPHSPARRRVLGATAGAVAAVVGGGLIGTSTDRSGGDRGPKAAFDVPEVVAADIDENLDAADEQSLAVSGLEPLVSTDFYQVDINATDPVLDADGWSLRVTGAVEEELTYGYGDLVDRPPENRFVTLRCVGESLNGRKLDNALWTGVPVMDLVEPAGVSPTCCVMLRAADDYYEEFPLSALVDGFLAYGMNGEVLPRAHGYPVRALVPGHWGEINVKWLTEIEVLQEEVDGYWEQRGWHGTGPVKTVAKLHVENRLDDGRIEVGGHAYAGTRGITRVEVSTDGGTTWADTVLSDPLPGEDVWRQWVHRYEPPDGRHNVVVRATDGTGTLQPEASSGAFPSGPSGWVSRTVQP